MLRLLLSSLHRCSRTVHKSCPYVLPVSPCPPWRRPVPLRFCEPHRRFNMLGKPLYWVPNCHWSLKPSIKLFFAHVECWRFAALAFRRTGHLKSVVQHAWKARTTWCRTACHWSLKPSFKFFMLNDKGSQPLAPGVQSSVQCPCVSGGSTSESPYCLLGAKLSLVIEALQVVLRSC
jgi:hypothetical protein